ncbi:contractile injection system protein, VgrG/Pvc8 family [Celeribacter ethanolicus]|uniref:contractile injection system protein, VgrG/Pvc8 family n=1 Tax=Celeribacter ethanolicus TaxID=1758178 RepID=UPI002467D32F|nr:contractile injection system protein, VgrG/Pvc8 family [Celeribacter ethanolicus]
MSFFSQTSRMGRLTTALGEDVLVLMRFEGEERVNGVFSYHVDCLAAADDIDFDALLGTHATVTLRTHDGSDKPFDGIISEARWMARARMGIATG